MRADPPHAGSIKTIPMVPQPSLSVSPGAPVVLAVTGYGGTAPFTYHWRLNGNEVTGATLQVNRLILAAVTPADAGEYTVLVQNDEGEALSQPFTLEVDPRFRSVGSGDLGGAYFSAAWGDLNGDGWPNLVVAGAGSAKVLLNSRDGTFQKIASPVCGADSGNFVALGDYDNDGRPDLLITELNKRALRVFHNDGTGHFASQSVENLDGRYAATTWIDLNGDGYLDFIMPGHEGVRSRVYINEAGTTLRRWQEGDPGQEFLRLPTWQFYMAWGDYDADGRLDAAVSGVQGALWVFHANPAGGYDEVTTLTRPDSWPNGHGELAWADYDGDGDLDLIVGTYSAGVTSLFRNNGGSLTQILDAEDVGTLLTDPPAMVGLAWGDYDNDGDLDIYVARNSYQSTSGTIFNYFYENLGAGKFRRVNCGNLTSSLNSTYSAQWVDYDRDGLLDLFVPAAEQGQSECFHNELAAQGNRNGWLEVRCEGRESPRDGIGASVRVRARLGDQDRWQVRQIAGTGSGQPLTAHFGLGDAPQVEVLRVQWPSGIVQELKGVTINQSLVVKEPPRLVPTGPCAFEVKCWPGMHFTVEASSDLETWTPVGQVLNVNGKATFGDAVGVHGACRFYRVVED